MDARPHLSSDGIRRARSCARPPVLRFVLDVHQQADCPAGRGWVPGDEEEAVHGGGRLEAGVQEAGGQGAQRATNAGDGDAGAETGVGGVRAIVGLMSVGASEDEDEDPVGAILEGEAASLAEAAVGEYGLDLVHQSCTEGTGKPRGTSQHP